jgi:membrane protein implicated in regulation of membrane protease activity
VILAATVVDLGARFVLSLRFLDVLRVEASLFLFVATILYIIYRRDPAAPGWRRGLQVFLIASFALAAVRAGVWASGQPVTLANAVILAVAVLTLGISRYRRRVRRRNDSHTKSGQRQ